MSAVVVVVFAHGGGKVVLTEVAVAVAVSPGHRGVEKVPLGVGVVSLAHRDCAMVLVEAEEGVDLCDRSGGKVVVEVAQGAVRPGGGDDDGFRLSLGRRSALRHVDVSVVDGGRSSSGGDRSGIDVRAVLPRMGASTVAAPVDCTCGPWRRMEGRGTWGVGSRQS